VRLFEHDEFEQAILQAARRLGVSEQFVEKDYYVTEILRIVVEQLDGKAVFKGGTSLSKGWGLINRFSEDIDLFVNREMFEPRPGGNKMDRILKDPGLRCALAHHSQGLLAATTAGGFGGLRGVTSSGSRSAAATLAWRTPQFVGVPQIHQGFSSADPEPEMINARNDEGRR